VNLPAAEAQKPEKPKLITPTGVRLLKNKSFDDSDKARKEILELYRACKGPLIRPKIISSGDFP